MLCVHQSCSKISSLQQQPTASTTTQALQPLKIRSSKATAHLPSTYPSVPPVALNNVSVVQGPVRLTNFLTTAAAAEKEEDEWLNLVKAAIEKQAVDNWISWLAYLANTYHAIIPPPAAHALLPLFTETADSTAMLRHSMDFTKAAVQYLNPGQIPVLTTDQPPFAMLKKYNGRSVGCW